MASNKEIQVENLDHLGLVAGIIDEIEIVKQINQLVGEQPGEIVSPGHAVKAMILNGLGLVSAPLYLFSKFFSQHEKALIKKNKSTPNRPLAEVLEDVLDSEDDELPCLACYL